MLTKIVIQVQNTASSIQALFRLLHHAQLDSLKHLVIHVRCMPQKQRDRPDAEGLESTFQPLGSRFPPLSVLVDWKISPALEQTLESVEVEFDMDNGVVEMYDAQTFRSLFGMAGSDEVMSMYALGDGTLVHKE
jgi:hypothetical protein